MKLGRNQCEQAFWLVSGPRVLDSAEDHRIFRLQLLQGLGWARGLGARVTFV